MTQCTIITDSKVKFRVELVFGNEIRVIENQKIFDLFDGWQKISVSILDDADFNIQDILLDNQSIKQLIYTSWVYENDKIIQPATSLWKKGLTWNIIVNSDHSLFRERVIGALGKDDYGTNLFEKYLIFYDSGCKLSKTFIPSVSQFFSRQHGLNIFPKNNIQNLPFISLDFKSWDDDIIFNEIKDIELKEHDDREVGKFWRWGFVFDKRKEIDLTKRNLNEWLNSIGLSDINTINISLLKSNGYIDSHRDRMRYTTPYDHQIHIPIYKNSNRKTKLAQSGILPHCTNIFNTKGYAHSVINQDDNDGYAMIINAHVTDEFVLKHMKNIDL